MRAQDIRIGTSGWRFQDWAGTFYPFRVPQSRWLEYYAARFTVGEINSTYYRIPPARSFAAVAERTPDNFEVFAKVHGDVTHARTHTRESMGRLLESLSPLRGNGKLKGLLAQFPGSFRQTPENLAYLRDVQHLADEVPLCVEFRHASWDNNEAQEQVRTLGLVWVSVDEPAVDELIAPGVRVTSDTAYVRLHGRNAAAWYNRAAGDRYDYNYSEQELVEWGERLLSESVQARRAYVLFNNCYHGQAPRNAQWLKQWTEQEGRNDT